MMFYSSTDIAEVVAELLELAESFDSPNETTRIHALLYRASMMLEELDEAAAPIRKGFPS